MEALKNKRKTEEKTEQLEKARPHSTISVGSDGRERKNPHRKKKGQGGGATGSILEEVEGK